MGPGIRIQDGQYGTQKEKNEEFSCFDILSEELEACTRA
jgi:hypothetical protein